MATINFGGLASGLDTEAIITALMDIERKPITRLENDKEYYNSRLSAFSNFEDKLNTLKSAFEDIDDSDKLKAFSANSASEEFFTIETSGNTTAGSYDIEVVNLARVQKDVSEGYTTGSETNFSAGTIDIEGTSITIENGDSLATVAEKINAANTGDNATGVSAALINDGSSSGYRVVLTGENASTTFSASATGISAEGKALSFGNTQTAQQATAIIDGITIVSDNNTLSDAISGVELSLLKENEAGESTRLGVESDSDAIKAKLDTFVSAYNGIIEFINDQEDSSWANDTGLRGTQRKLQNMLVSNTGNSGDFQYLIDIGIKTDAKEGTISLDSSKVKDAILNDFDSIEKLFLGEDGVEGIVDKFTGYLDNMTDSIDGLYATRKQSTESSIKSIDRNIESLEMRLEQRENNMRAEYQALELLMSEMNSTSSYLAQQITNMNTNNR